VEPNGSIVLVLDVMAVLELAQHFVEPLATAAKDAELPPKAPTLLVVDDSLMVRELQRSILERAGYQVQTANDGKEALTMLTEHPPDLVITDIEMPNVDGIALTANIRSHPRLANIPVLIVTSRTNEDDHRRGLDAGADALIVKSAFDEPSLLSAVSRLLGDARELDGAAARRRRSDAKAAPPLPTAAGAR
jgi:CheY-like chemotaxis protein